jgi:hypothetical protein
MLAICMSILLVGLVGNTSLNHPDEHLSIPAIHIGIFAAAVMTTAFVRNAVYGAILSIAVLYLGNLVFWTAWLAAGEAGWVTLNRNWSEPTPAKIVGGSIVTFTVSTILAWLAVRYDWGRKSRY